VVSVPFVVPDFAHILIARLQSLFQSTLEAWRSSGGDEGLNVYSVESQRLREGMPLTAVPTTASVPQTDRAEASVMIQRWDQARERRYQTIRALRLLMEAHTQATQSLARLVTPSAPSTSGDDMSIVGRLFLTAEDVPPLVTDEELELTDRDAEGEVDEGED
jgi:hypothetical protein